MSSALNWFEIPTKDLERAAAFYRAVLDAEVPIVDVGMEKLGMLPVEPGGIGGALVQREDMEPATQGTFVYLNGGEDLSVPLSRVEAAGGQSLSDKIDIGEHGFIAVFLDTEGNKVGLHSMG